MQRRTETTHRSTLLLPVLVFVAALAAADTSRAGDLWVGDYNRSGVKRFDGQTGAGIATEGQTELAPATGIAFGPDGNAYVGGGNDHRVFRYDRESGDLTGPFVGNVTREMGRCSSVAFGPDGDIYVANPAGDDVLHFDGASGLFEEVFVPDEGRGRPFAIQFGPDDHLYVLTGGSVNRHDGETGEFLEVFATGVGFSSPFDLAFGPGGDLYVATGFTSRVARYDGSTGAYLGDFVTAGSGGLAIARGLTFGPDGHLYVSSRNTGSVLRYHGSTGAFLDTFASGLSEPAFLAFAPDAPSPSVERQIFTGGVLNGIRAHPGTRMGYAIDQGGGRLVEFNGATGAIGKTANLPASPIRVAVDHLNDKLYVSHFGGNYVTVLRASTFAFLRTIPTANSGVELDINPYTAKLYVANRGAASVSVIDTITDTVVKTLPTGPLPSGLIVDPIANRVYVTIQGANQLLVIDGKTDTALTLVPVGTWPAGVAANPLTKRVYVANLSAGNISVIDADTLTVVKTVPVGAGPDLIAVNHLTNRLYVANSGEGTVSVLDGETETEVARLTTGPTVVTVDVDLGTGRIYAANRGNGTVSVLQDPGFEEPVTPLPAAPEVVSTVPVGDNPLSVDVHAASSRVLVGNSGSQTISQIDATDLVVTRTNNVGRAFGNVHVDPRTGDLYYMLDLPAQVVHFRSDWQTFTSYVAPVFRLELGIDPGDPATGRSRGVLLADSGRLWVLRSVFASIALPAGFYESAAVHEPLAAGFVGGVLRAALVDLGTARSLGGIAIPTGSRWTLVAPGLQRVFFVGAGSSLSVLDAVSVSVIGTVTAPAQYTYDVGFDPATERLYLATDQGVLVFDVRADRFLHTIDVPGGHVGVAVDPSSGRVFVPSGTTPGVVSVIAIPGPVTTETGDDVAVEPQVALPGGETTSVELGFSSVTSAGTTTVTAEEPAVAPPVGFRFGESPVVYDVSTTAEFNGTVTLCFSWSEGDFADESGLRLYHGENGQWVDVTTYVDTVSNEICGEVTSLSPFVLVQPLYEFTLLSPLYARGTVELKAGRTLPVKFDLRDAGGDPVPDADPTLLAFRTDGSEEVEMTVTGSGGSGNDFRYDPDAELWILNLSTKGWNAGEYRLEILPGDGEVYEVPLLLWD